MNNVFTPFHLLVISLAGWLNRHQQAIVDYLIEENRVLKDQLDGQRLRFTDAQRRKTNPGGMTEFKVHSPISVTS